jgi:apolipoprotein N-acyltransferase
MRYASDRAWLVARARWVLAGLGSAILVRATVPPFDLAPLALFAWVPLLLLAGRASLRMVLGAALLQGVVLNLSAQSWVGPGLESAASASPGAAFGAWILLAVLQGLRTPAVLLVVHLAAVYRCPVWVAFPLVQATAEVLLPGLFPWTLALQVHVVPQWLQAASFGGLAAVTLWLGIVNGLVTCAFLCGRSRLASVYVGAATAVVALVSALGHAALLRVDEREAGSASGRILVGHFGTLVDEQRREPVPLIRTQTFARLKQDGTVDLAIWPETVVQNPTPMRRVPQLARDYLLRDRRGGTSAPVIGVPLLFGVAVEDAGRLFNSAVLVREPGIVLGRYDKQALVFFGESRTIVAGLPDLGSLAPTAGDFSRGSGAATLQVGSHRVAVSICYEDILPELVRRSILAGDPELLVNLTSDAWFRGTDAVDFHLALAKLRSVEHRKYLVRSTRDGASAVIDSGGRVLRRVDAASTEAFVATIRWLPGSTIYARYGSAWLFGAAVVAVVVALARSRRGRRTAARQRRRGHLS